MTIIVGNANMRSYICIDYSLSKKSHMTTLTLYYVHYSELPEGGPLGQVERTLKIVAGSSQEVIDVFRAHPIYGEMRLIRVIDWESIFVA